MEKIKVLQFPVANAKGGVTQYVLNIWEYINKDKFQFDFVTFSKELDFEERLKGEGCRFYHLTCRAEDNLEQFQKEVSQVFENHYDILHLHTSFWKSFEVEKLAKKAGIPKIILHANNTGIHADENRAELTERHNHFKKILAEDEGTEYWACSHEAAEFLYGDRISKDRIKIMNYSVDLPKFKFNKEERQSYRDKLGWGDKYIFGHVGRLSYQKNHMFLLRVFKQVCENMDDVRLLLIGKGVLESELKEYVKNQGLQDKVFFAGARDDVNGLMQAMDCFCLPSWFEGLGIVLLEAQTAGLPCFATDVIPQSANAAGNITYLPLDEAVWISEMEKKPIIQERESTYELVAEAGYDIHDVVQEVERQYLI